MKVIIRDTEKEAALWVADRIANAIKAKAKVSDKPFVLGLPTGSTPLKVYAELVRKNKAGELSFKNVITFNMDEYVGLPVEHPESYHSFMYHNLFDHIDIPRENIHILPFSPLQSRTRVVTLTDDTIRVNSRFFGGDVNLVPKQAMSVGVATVLGAKEVVIMAFGPKKARAIGEAIEGPITHKNTVSALQNHPDGIVVMDEDAAGELRVSSYKYFKAVEAAEMR